MTAGAGLIHLYHPIAVSFTPMHTLQLVMNLFNYSPYLKNVKLKTNKQLTKGSLGGNWIKEILDNGMNFSVLCRRPYYI